MSIAAPTAMGRIGSMRVGATRGYGVSTPTSGLSPSEATRNGGRLAQCWTISTARRLYASGSRLTCRPHPRRRLLDRRRPEGRHLRPRPHRPSHRSRRRRLRRCTHPQCRSCRPHRQCLRWRHHRRPSRLPRLLAAWWPRLCCCLASPSPCACSWCTASDSAAGWARQLATAWPSTTRPRPRPTRRVPESSNRTTVPTTSRQWAMTRRSMRSTMRRPCQRSGAVVLGSVAEPQGGCEAASSRGSSSSVRRMSGQTSLSRGAAPSRAGSSCTMVAPHSRCGHESHWMRRCSP